MLGSMLKQIINTMEVIPEDISRGLKEQLSTIHGYEPKLVDIVKILQLISLTKPTFMCIDGLDGCMEAQRVRILDSLQQILKRASDTRIFMTGRPMFRRKSKNVLLGGW